MNLLHFAPQELILFVLPMAATDIWLLRVLSEPPAVAGG